MNRMFQKNRKDCSEDEFFRNLYGLYYERLCYYANTFIPQMDVCRDLVQEVFIKLLTNPVLLDGVGRPDQYLLRMTKNYALDYLKNSKNNQDFNELILAELVESDCIMEDIEVGELSSIINSAIERLPVIQKEIFKLNRFQDKTYGEIAEICNLSPKTVEYHMSKALVELRFSLKDYLVLIIWLLVV